VVKHSIGALMTSRLFGFLQFATFCMRIIFQYAPSAAIVLNCPFWAAGNLEVRGRPCADRNASIHPYREPAMNAVVTAWGVCSDSLLDGTLEPKRGYPNESSSHYMGGGLIFRLSMLYNTFTKK